MKETCHHHFQSVANQVEFYALRDKLEQARDSDRSEQKRALQDFAADGFFASLNLTGGEHPGN